MQRVVPISSHSYSHMFIFVNVINTFSVLSGVLASELAWLPATLNKTESLLSKFVSVKQLSSIWNNSFTACSAP